MYEIKEEQKENGEDIWSQFKDPEKSFEDESHVSGRGDGNF